MNQWPEINNRDPHCTKLIPSPLRVGEVWHDHWPWEPCTLPPGRKASGEPSGCGPEEASSILARPST